MQTMLLIVCRDCFHR